MLHLFWWLLPPVYVFCWDLAQDWDLPAMQALHCAGCPASLQGLQTVYPEADRTMLILSLPRVLGAAITATTLCYTGCCKSGWLSRRRGTISEDERGGTRRAFPHAWGTQPEKYSLLSPHHIIHCRVISSCCISPHFRHLSFDSLIPLSLSIPTVCSMKLFIR